MWSYFWARRAVATGMAPWTTVRKEGGKYLGANFARVADVWGACSEGYNQEGLFFTFWGEGGPFRTTVFPAAMALRAGQRVHQTGKFHGPMTRITPNGSFRIRHLL